VFYLQYVRGYSPLESGLWFIPFAIAQMIASPTSASMVNRFGIRAVAVSGLVLVTLALLGYQLFTVDSPMWLVAVVFFVQGFGMGNIMPPATTAIMGAVPRERAGVGSAVNNTFRQVGGALGLAVLGSIVSVRYRGQITPYLDGVPAGLRDTAAESIGATFEAVGAAGGPQSVAAIQPMAFDAFVNAMHLSALISAGIALIGVLVAYRFLPGRPPTPTPAADVAVHETASA
jgi:MFS family permease